MLFRLGATLPAAAAAAAGSVASTLAATRISLLVLDCDGIIYDSNRLKTAAYRSTLDVRLAPSLTTREGAVHASGSE